MLAQRIIDTLRFFDIQQLPLTSFEIHKYLVSDKTALKSKLDDKYELPFSENLPVQAVHLDTVVTQLDILVREQQIATRKGYYCLAGREEIIDERLVNYLNGVKRERLVRRYLLFARHIPFVRGVALAGSQALGQQRPTSDIDLLIITESNKMWTARNMLSAWLQLMGVRRYGKKIANRFCLNHYLASPKEVDAERNLYKAMEYIKLRPVVYPQNISQFQRANQKWIKQFFPNIYFDEPVPQPQSAIQRFLEKIFTNSFGDWLEKWLGGWQVKRIHQDQFVFVRDDELSLHPQSRHETLLQTFFQK